MDSETANKNPFRRAAALIPNALTLGAILCGLTSIELSAESDFGWAMAAIAGAVILDVFDGYAARKLNAVTAMGAELDSLADFVNFGVAPAVLLYERSLHVMGSAGWLVAAIYALATGFRLARFNIRSGEPNGEASKTGFQGLPSTGAAAALLISVLLTGAFLGTGPSRFALAAAMIVLSALMVSSIKVPSLSTLRRACGHKFGP